MERFISMLESQLQEQSYYSSCALSSFRRSAASWAPQEADTAEDPRAAEATPEEEDTEVAPSEAAGEAT